MPKPITAVETKIMPDPKLEKRTRRIQYPGRIVYQVPDQFLC